MLCVPVALTYTFGKMAGSVRQGAAILGAMAIIFGAWLAIGSTAEHQANPAVAAAGVTQQPAGNMEGKDARFGDTSSVLSNVVPTHTPPAPPNSASNSFNPLAASTV